MPHPLSLNQQIERQQERLIELSAWLDRARHPLPPAQFVARSDAGWSELNVGDPWPQTAYPVQLRFLTEIPATFDGAPLWVRLDPGAEALLIADGQAVGSLNSEQDEHLITERAQAGAPLEIIVEAVPHTRFGRPVAQPTLRAAELFTPEAHLAPLYEDLAAIHDAAGALNRAGRSPLAALLVDLLDDALAQLELPRSPTEAYLARMLQARRSRGAVMPGRRPAQQLSEGLWEGPLQTEAEPLPLSEEQLKRMVSVRARLGERLIEIRDRHPPQGALATLGHAHLDLAWLWPTQETRRKARRTFSGVLSLMARYPELVFAQSSAQIYAFLENDDPELFSRIKDRVAQGRWELVGGTWVEPDGNLLGGESWARQLLMGQQYFLSRFSRMATVGWLPDTFGTCGNLPQLFRQAGLTSLFATKLSWNETSEFPHDLYFWEGIDGTRILTHSLRNDAGYNGRIAADLLLQTWDQFRGQRHHDESMFTFGYGDGGGGPTARMLERQRRFSDFPGLPRLRPKRADVTLERAGTNLPVWTGAQYLELHRGTYSSQGRLKSLDRRLSARLVDAEVASSLAKVLLGVVYPKPALETAWTVLLRNQFHDILPGSSVATVNAEAAQELERALNDAQRLLTRRLELMSEQVRSQETDDERSGVQVDNLETLRSAIHEQEQTRLVVWNLQLHRRWLQGRLPRPKLGRFLLRTPQGQTVPWQAVSDDEIVVSCPEVLVPGMGYLTLEVHAPEDSDGEARSEPPGVWGSAGASGGTLENDLLRAEIGVDGCLLALIEKSSGRSVLSGRGNQLWAYTDIPRAWEAWDIDADYEQGKAELESVKPPSLIEVGPTRAAIEVVRRYKDARIKQRYQLWAGSRRLDIVTEVRWAGRRTMVRARFPLAVRSSSATVESAFGLNRVPTHTNHPHDAARFEVPGMRFIDLSEPDFGVSLWSRDKAGYSARGSTLGLTLMRSPMYPDPRADEGEHRFEYGLLVHADPGLRSSIQEAVSIASPLRGVLVKGTGGGWPKSQGALSVGLSSAQLGTLKLSESGDDLVLRIYESQGRRGALELVDRLGVDAWDRADLLERPQESPKAQRVTPFEVLTLRGTPGDD